MERKGNWLPRLLRAGLWAVLAVYALVLVKIILLKYGLGAGLRSVNFVPFLFVKDLLHPSTSLGVVLKNVLGNFALFIPLGVLAPALLPKMDRFIRPVLLGLGVSALFEALQLAFGLGATDVDDLLLNTLGAAAGSGLYFGAFGRLKGEWKPRLAALAFLTAFGLAGVLALWLYAPGELPAVVVNENLEVLGGLDRDSYALSARAEGLENGCLLCRVYGSEGEAWAASPDEYPLAPGAALYLQTISCQYSPNGNIQKTICSYAAADAARVAAHISENGALFADVWLDGSGACTAAIFTLYQD